MGYRILTGFQAALLAGGASIAIAAPAAANESAVSFNIPSQDLSSALRAFANASDVDLLYSPELVAKLKTQGVKGVMPPRAALNRLLIGTGIIFVETAPNVISLRSASTQPKLTADAGNDRNDAGVGQNSPVSGTVVDAATGAALPGAVVTIDGTDLKVVTDERGEFNFPAVRQGERKLKFDYLGEQTQFVTVMVEPGHRSILNFKFGDAGTEIVVVGYRSGIQKALNQQKNADNSATVVSADLLGGFPAETVSEALRRVPGVAFGRNTNTGEGSRITVRGFSSEAINIQLNGLDLQGTGRSRTVDLSGFLADNISQVTIQKTLLPSHEATGSGGLVEIETKSGLDYGDSQINLNIEREQTIAKGFGREFQAGAIFAKKLAPNFGVSATLQYRKTDRRNYNANFSQVIPPVLPAGIASASTIPYTLEYPFDPDIEQRLINGGSYDFRQRMEKSIAGSINLAWDVSDSTNLRLDYQHNVNESEGYYSGVRLNYAVTTTQMPIPELNGALRTRSYLTDFVPGMTTGTFDQSTTYDVISLRGDSKAGRFRFNYKVGYSRTNAQIDDTRFDVRSARILATSPLFAQLIDPNTAVFNIDDDVARTRRAVGGVFTIGDNGVPLPALSQAGVDYVLNDNNFRVFWADRLKDRAPSYSLIGEFSTRYAPATKFVEYLEVGGKFTGHTQKANGIGVGELSNLAQRYSAAGIGGSVSTPLATIGTGLLTPLNLNAIGLGGLSIPSIHSASAAMIFKTIEGLLADNPATTTYNENRYVLTDYSTQTLSQNTTANQIPTDTREDKIALYGEAKFNLGKLSVVGGLRWEQEKRKATTLTSPNIILPDFTFVDRAALFNAGLINFFSEGGTNDTLTPSVLATWRPSNQIVARAGYFRSTVNPSYLATTGPSTWVASLLAGRESVLYSVSNPNLKPSTTDNFDVDLSYYFNDAPGLIRAGFFYKKISNNFTNILSRPANTDLRAEFATYVAPLIPTYPALGSLPASTVYLLSTPQNGEGGKIWGLEFEVNRKLTFLPGFLRDFGVIANATYTNAKFPTLVAAYDPTLATPANPTLAFFNLSLDRPLRDEAEWVYNLSLDYERDGFQGRLIYTHQDATANSFDEFNLNSITPGYSTLDARLSYSFKQSGALLTVFLEGDDLLRNGKKPIVNGAISSQFGNGSASFNYPQSFQFIGGRTVTFGIRGKF